MKALSVDGIEKTISEVDIEGVDDLEFLLGGGSLVSDDLDPEHQIFFDENSRTLRRKLLLGHK